MPVFQLPALCFFARGLCPALRAGPAGVYNRPCGSIPQPTMMGAGELMGNPPAPVPSEWEALGRMFHTAPRSSPERLLCRAP